MKATRGGGYGGISIKVSDEKMTVMGAHKVSWMLFKKAVIPKGLSLCHKCDTPSCVNPDHLVPGNQAFNYWDSAKKGRDRWSKKGYDLSEKCAEFFRKLPA